jgi:aryl-alcohol dehydrogenase-like predicted oxidoreductase
MAPLPRRPLGTSSLEVTPLALGSWRTFERIGRQPGVAVMRAARAAGIAFLDDARYNDEPGTAPIPSGYSEIVFGELFRAAGFQRDAVVVSNKLWWEFWPEQTAAEELDGSRGRMGFDHVDLIYAERPPAGIAMADLVRDANALIAVGKARAWGVLNWQAAQIAEAVAIAAAQGVPSPCAAQLPYSLVTREWVEGPDYVAALGGASVVASAVLESGALTGRYAQAGAAGRLQEARADPRRAAAFRAGEALSVLARELDTSAAALAIAFALTDAKVASVLFGASTPAQVEANVAAWELLGRLDDEQRARLRAIGA